MSKILWWCPLKTLFFMAPGQLGARLGASTFYIESLWENEKWLFISILMNILKSESHI